MPDTDWVSEDCTESATYCPTTDGVHYSQPDGPDWKRVWLSRETVQAIAALFPDTCAACGHPLAGEHDCPSGATSTAEPLHRVCSRDGCETCPEHGICPVEVTDA